MCSEPSTVPGANDGYLSLVDVLSPSSGAPTLLVCPLGLSSGCREGRDQGRRRSVDVPSGTQEGGVWDTPKDSDR